VFLITVVTTTIIFVEYNRQDWDDFLTLKLKAVWGILRYEFVIPLMEFDKMGIQFRKVKDKTLASGKREDEKVDVKIMDIIKKFNYFRESYNRNSVMICKIKDYLKGRLKLDNYKLEAEIGTGDAFYTALANGLAWTAAGIISSYFLNNFKSGDKHIRIISNFDEKKFDLVFTCIFRTRFVHIIIVIFMLLAGYSSLNINQNRTIGGGLVG
jgi:hypothetical protein